MRMPMLWTLPIALSLISAGKRDDMRWEERRQDNNLRTIQEGIPGYDKETIIYSRNGRKYLRVELGEPVEVATSEPGANISWGFFQFPDLVRDAHTGHLLIKWQNAQDNEKYFGKYSGIPSGRVVSTDCGKTWAPSVEQIHGDAYNTVTLEDGDVISCYGGPTLDCALLDLPEIVEKRGPETYYRLSELPDTLQGIYVARWDCQTGRTERIHAKVEDPGALKFSITHGYEYFPTKWWGDLRLLDDGSVAAVMYYTSYETPEGKADRALSCSCYRSWDRGDSWKLVGKIPYVYDEAADPNGPKRTLYGYSEPAFEILPDGSWLCVLRTTDNALSPCYWSKSMDEGRTWTDPVPFIPNGVMPRLLTLDNGVTVLLSGRPGVQLRFSADGHGETWTDPFDFVPYAESVAKVRNFNVSCGYTRVVPAEDKDSFYVVYSTFNHEDDLKTLKSKSIWFRKVRVTKLSRK